MTASKDEPMTATIEMMEAGGRTLELNVKPAAFNSGSPVAGA